MQDDNDYYYYLLCLTVLDFHNTSTLIHNNADEQNGFSEICKIESYFFLLLWKQLWFV